MPKKDSRMAGWKEYFDKVLIHADHADPSRQDMLEGQDSFQGRRNVSTTLPSEKGGGRSSDVVQWRRADGA